MPLCRLTAVGKASSGTLRKEFPPVSKIHFSLAILIAAIFVGAFASESQAVHPFSARKSAKRAQYYNWHGNYAHTSYGQPVSLVVPPTARLQTNYSWGMGSSRVSRIDHQFGRSYSGAYRGGRGFYQTPAWPSDTSQFGTYYVRAPW